MAKLYSAVIPRCKSWYFFVTVLVEKQYMQKVLELAARAKGKTSPNPLVGALLVKRGKVIAEGYHKHYGGNHAEVNAIRKARKEVKGATLFLNLEPCCHTGQTGPCTEAIIKAGIKRVVFAVKDPNPKVGGRGAKILRRAGIKVESGLLRTEAIKLNESYFGFHANGRPFVTLKLAQTLDGQIATKNGSSQWISSKESRKIVHRLRAENDAVIVGGGTLRQDDPSLTVRHVKGDDPFRIIVTRSVEINKKSNIIANNDDGRTIIATTSRTVDKLAGKFKKSNLTFWELKTNRQRKIDLNDLLEKASAFGLRSILVEGGQEIATSFLKAGLVDKVVIMTAPRILGKGISSIGDLNSLSIDDSISFDDVTLEPCGDDMIFTGYPKRKN